MGMRAAGMLAALGWVSGWCAPAPQAWVPMRWPWQDARSLELLAGTPINCLLLEGYAPELVAAAEKRGLVTLARIAPGGDTVAVARAAKSSLYRREVTDAAVSAVLEALDRIASNQTLPSRMRADDPRIHV